GNVFVTQAETVGSTITYTILFGGTLSASDQTQITGGGSNGVTNVSGTTFRDGGAGALRNIAGNNTYAGTVTLQDYNPNQIASPNLDAIGVNAGTTLSMANTGTIQDTNLPQASASTLVKVGTGTLALSFVNTYTGATQLNAGVVNVSASTASATLNTASG